MNAHKFKHGQDQTDDVRERDWSLTETARCLWSVFNWMEEIFQELQELSPSSLIVTICYGYFFNATCWPGLIVSFVKFVYKKVRNYFISQKIEINRFYLVINEK
jgi:hypothetical protein